MNKVKKKYLPPTITAIQIIMESGFAASSAKTVTTNNTGEIKKEWKDIPDDNREIIF